MQTGGLATAAHAARCTAIVPRLAHRQPRAAAGARLDVNHVARAQPQRRFASASSPATATAARPSVPTSTSVSPSVPAASPGAAPAAAAAESTECLDFDDVSKSFAVKSGWEIARSLLVFKLCSSKLLVANARRLLDLSEALLGRRITHWALRQTFFGHFCAGETAAEVAVVIARLERSGLGGILDYAAEADVAAKPTSVATAGAEGQTPLVARDRTGIQSARTYDYAGEADCDANAAICRSCIEAAGAKGDGQGFAAIKLTALGKPELLEHLSLILTQTKTLFLTFATEGDARAASTSAAASSAAASSPPASSAAASAAATPNPNPSISRDLQITYAEFQRGLRGINVSLGESNEAELFKRMDRDGSGSIDFLEWITFLDPKLLGGLNPSLRIAKSTGIARLSQTELEKVHAMIARLESLASLAARHRVRLMIDAEQTYFQPAIDHLVLDLQRKYNRPGSMPVIFNTYQCYLRDSLPRVLLDLERSKREGFTFAAKIVRGAYMVQERKRAREMGYADPIQPSIQHTHDKSVFFLLRVAFCARESAEARESRQRPDTRIAFFAHVCSCSLLWLLFLSSLSLATITQSQLSCVTPLPLTSSLPHTMSPPCERSLRS